MCCILLKVTYSNQQKPTENFLSSVFVRDSREEGHWIGAHHVEIDLVAKQVANVADAVLDHGRTLERQTPGDDAHILGQSHRAQHFWAKHARIANLDPALELGREAKDLHRRLRVRVVRRLELDVGDT